jgi:hypothetical protein
VICIHCLGTAGNTKDHVFPKSWYTQDTPENVQRPTAPSCLSCNNNLGKVEKILFIKLSACIDPLKAEASGINKKLLVSLGVGVEENILSKKEKIARIKEREKLLLEITPYNPTIKSFPGLGLHEGYPPEMHSTIKVPDKELKMVSMKIIRGLEYKYSNRYIIPPLIVKIYFIPDEISTTFVDNILKKHGLKETYGPGFQVHRAEAMDDTKPAVLYKITIWGTLNFYASVI